MDYNIEVEKTKMQLWVLRVMALTLASVLSATVLVMLVGLFTPNTVIDNREIFKILGPAFSMVVGAFVGSFATMMGMKTEPLNPNAKLQAVNDDPTPPPAPAAAPAAVDTPAAPAVAAPAVAAPAAAPADSDDDDDDDDKSAAPAAPADHGPF